MKILSTTPKNQYYFQREGIVYNISNTTPSHESCTDALSLYNLSANTIYSMTDGKIDVNKVKNHIDYYLITDSDNKEYYLWLDVFIQDGDSFNTTSKKFAPNPENGHYYPSVALSSYTHMYDCELTKEIQQYVSQGKNLAAIKASLPAFLTATTNDKLTIDNKTITVKSNGAYYSDTQLQAKIEEAIKNLTETYGNQLIKKTLGQDSTKTVTATIAAPTTE